MVLKKLDHHGIIKLYDWGDNGKLTDYRGSVYSNLVYIVTEYVTGDNIFKLIKTLRASGEEGARYIMKQMVETLLYLEQKGVAHLDLKLENIMLDDQYNVKLVDFGFSQYRNINKLKDRVGTPNYMAPEILEGREYNGFKTDIFSLGILMFTIVQGIFPFETASDEDKYYAMYLINPKAYFKKVKGENLSPEFKDLFNQLISFESAQRPTLKEISEHPWMHLDFDKDGITKKLDEVF